LGLPESVAPSNASCTRRLLCVSVNKNPTTNMAKMTHVVKVMVMVMVMGDGGASFMF
jgi:hypothetical protein